MTRPGSPEGSSRRRQSRAVLVEYASPDHVERGHASRGQETTAEDGRVDDLCHREVRQSDRGSCVDRGHRLRGPLRIPEASRAEKSITPPWRLSSGALGSVFGQPVTHPATMIRIQLLPVRPEATPAAILAHLREGTPGGLGPSTLVARARPTDSSGTRHRYRLDARGTTCRRTA